LIGGKKMLKHKLFFVWLILALLAFPALTACRSTEDTPPTEATSAEVTIVDARGRSVTFAEPPQRIVIAGRANFMLNDAVYLFPAAPARVSALTRATQRSDDFMALLDPDYAQKMRFSADSGADEIAAAQPDVVLLKSFMAESMGNALEQLLQR
jgi:iron complex transport system substrate-binding protein